MDFRMSEQPRTITIYNLLAGTNEFIGEGDAYIPPSYRSASKQYRYCTARYSGWFSWLFSTVMSHRGISLKIIGVKRFMTWLPATRYLFLNSAHYRKMSPVIPGRGVSEVERHSSVKDTEAEKLFRIREAEETKTA